MDINDITDKQADTEAKSKSKTTLPEIVNVINNGALKLNDNDKDFKSVKGLTTLSSNAESRTSILKESTQENIIQDNTVKEQKTDTDDSKKFVKANTQGKLTTNTKSCATSLPLTNQPCTSQNSQSCSNNFLETEKENEAVSKKRDLFEILLKHYPQRYWFDDKCSELVKERKIAENVFLAYRSQENLDNYYKINKSLKKQLRQIKRSKLVKFMEVHISENPNDYEIQKIIEHFQKVKKPPRRNLNKEKNTV